MHTLIHFNDSSLTYLLAEDVGAPELRNPLNSGVRAGRGNGRTARSLRALRGFIAMAFGRGGN